MEGNRNLSLTRISILEAYPEETFMFADGFDSAILGIDESSMRVIYSVYRCVSILADEMSMDEAREYFEFNVRGSYMGEKTPIWCADNF